MNRHEKMDNSLNIQIAELKEAFDEFDKVHLANSIQHKATPNIKALHLNPDCAGGGLIVPFLSTVSHTKKFRDCSYFIMNVVRGFGMLLEWGG